jgi:hypothetical protein
MKRFLMVFLVLAAALSAQPVLSLSQPVPVTPGLPAMSTLTLTGNPTDATAIVAFDFAASAEIKSIVSRAAGKLGKCAAKRCILYATTAPVGIVSGPVATLTFTMPDTATDLVLSGIHGVTAAGDAVPVTTSATPVTLTPKPPPSPCDLNSDGLVNSLDVTSFLAAFVAEAMGGACGPADINANGTCDAGDVQRIVAASLGGACRIGQ